MPSHGLDLLIIWFSNRTVHYERTLLWFFNTCCCVKGGPSGPGEPAAHRVRGHRRATERSGGVPSADRRLPSLQVHTAQLCTAQLHERHAPAPYVIRGAYAIHSNRLRLDRVLSIIVCAHKSTLLDYCTDTGTVYEYSWNPRMTDEEHDWIGKMRDYAYVPSVVMLDQ